MANFVDFDACHGGGAQTLSRSPLGCLNESKGQVIPALLPCHRSLRVGQIFSLQKPELLRKTMIYYVQNYRSDGAKRMFKNPDANAVSSAGSRISHAKIRNMFVRIYDLVVHKRMHIGAKPHESGVYGYCRTFARR